MGRFAKITLSPRFAAFGRRVRDAWDDDHVARWRGRIKILAFAAGGAFLALALFGQVPADVGPFATTVSARPAVQGETVARLAPLGDMRVDTHRWPLRFEVSVDQLSFEEAQLIADDPERIEDLGDDVADELASAFRHLALRSAVVAVLGGALGAFIARHNWRAALAGTTTGVVLVVTFLGGTIATFDVQAVNEPRYSGLLTMTDRAVGDVESIIERYDEYRDQLSDLVGNVVTLYLAAEGLPTDDVRDDTIRVLHVTDLHLSLHGLDVMERLVDQFDVDVIADTGDTTDWGSDWESDYFVPELDRFDVPYVWVRGNHDSSSTQEEVEALDGTVVLDDDSESVGGLRFWGVGDPRFTPDQQEDVSVDEQREIADEYAFDVADMVDDQSLPSIDVALVHDPRLAEQLGGRVPLVLAGHLHDRDAYTVGDDDETTVLVEGSTGGAGLRGLQGEEPEPITASVLYFDPGPDGLVAYDHITVEGLGGGATIERRVVLEGSDENSPDTEAEDDPDTEAESDESDE